MSVFKVLLVITLGTVSVKGITREATDEEYIQFPRLFHLDDYDRCMLKTDAVYCLGTFDIVPDGSPGYRMLQEYSSDIKNFNRTRIHRGYCVSERCPAPEQCSRRYSNESCGGSPLSHVQRFERCVSRFQKHPVRLRTQEYCRSRQDVTEEWKVETPHLVFLAVVVSILVMNVVGTCYDVMNTGEKNKQLTAWSIWSNWTILVGDFPTGDPRVPPLMQMEASRFIMMLVVILCHSSIIHSKLFLGNPRYVDQLSHKWLMKLIYNGHSSVQIFMVLSYFLLAQKILALPRASFSMLPKMLLKRIVRISPVYLLALGYAATWWPATGSGPQWKTLVEDESDECREHFWSFAFFVGNYFNHRPCLISSWYLKVDMQLYLVMVTVAVWTSRLRRVVALQVLAAGFLLALLGTAGLAYSRSWAPLPVTVGPEVSRVTFSTSEVFTSFCTQPVANVGTTLAGLFLAYFMAELRSRGFFKTDHKWLMFSSRLTAFMLPAWLALLGQLYLRISSRTALAVLLAAERPLVAALFGYILFGIYGDTVKQPNMKLQNGKIITASNIQKTKVKGFFRNALSCRLMYPLGRMSLAVMMLHWPINLTFAASRRGLYYTSVLDMVTDLLATACLSYLAALPVTLLVDIPAQQMLAALPL